MTNTSKMIETLDIRPLKLDEIEAVAGGVWAGKDGTRGCILRPRPKGGIKLL